MAQPRHAGKHAEIAGAGIGGLALAAALAQRGWSVTVHERAAELRELGVGIGLWGNGQEVLKVLGAFDDLAKKGSWISRWELLDEKQRVMNDGRHGLIVLLRTELHRALVDAARKAGVEIMTSSHAVAAEPSGELVIEDGRRRKADLVVGADGYHSKIRGSLGVAQTVDYVTNAHITRVVVARTESEKEEYGCEHWSGGHRVGIMMCGPRLVNMFLSTPESPEEIRTKKVDRDRWGSLFPHLRHAFDRIEPAAEVRWDRYIWVRCNAWSVGRAAILGDAAHGMPATVAQGAGLALADALSLALALERCDDIAEGLRNWEMGQRPVIESTQRVALLLVLLSKNWPANLLDMRSDMVKAALHSKEMETHLTMASRHMARVSEEVALAAH